MKKIVTIVALTLGLINLHAQTETKRNETSYNKWSIEVAGGLNKPQRPFSAKQYYTAIPNPFVVDLGARYMFNNKFGLKADIGYDSFTDGKNSATFKSNYYRADLQAVANLGRIMNFETWTKTIGLLGHTGFGMSMLESKKMASNDKMINFIAGVTAQVRLTDRLALTGDFSTILNASQDATFDGIYRDNLERGFSGIIFNGTVGLNIYLGKQNQHADWVVVSDNADITVLENKIANLEALVNKIPEQKPQVIVEKPITTTIVSDKDPMKEMINDKYYSVYFDFNKSTPIENSTAAIDVVLTYLRKNPSASLDIIGYADQVGSLEYNEKLSGLRANNVKTIFEKAGVSPSRLNVVSAGADTSIQKDYEEANRLARRVTFRVK